MNLTEFRQALADNPAAAVRFVINDQAAIADHFHVTEVGCVEKRFVDCGGKPRVVVTCVLQTLVAHDVQHRLTTDKLAAIMKLVDSLDLPADAPVEVEHQERSVSIDAVEGCSVEEGTVLFRLAPKQTACLAEDACGLGPTTPSQTDGVQAEGSLPVLGGECCGGTSGCC